MDSSVSFETAATAEEILKFNPRIRSGSTAMSLRLCIKKRWNMFLRISAARSVSGDMLDTFGLLRSCLRTVDCWDCETLSSSLITQCFPWQMISVEVVWVYAMTRDTASESILWTDSLLSCLLGLGSRVAYRDYITACILVARIIHPSQETLILRLLYFLICQDVCIDPIATIGLETERRVASAGAKGNVLGRQHYCTCLSRFTCYL